jgi:hypothetical protein
MLNMPIVFSPGYAFSTSAALSRARVPSAASTASEPVLPSGPSSGSPCLASAIVAGEMPPLCTTARWKSPRASGDTSSENTFAPPADSPKIVTRSASPPNAAAFSRTQASARIRSSVP